MNVMNIIKIIVHMDFHGTICPARALFVSSSWFSEPLLNAVAAIDTKYHPL